MAVTIERKALAENPAIAQAAQVEFARHNGEAREHLRMVSSLTDRKCDIERRVGDLRRKLDGARGKADQADAAVAKAEAALRTAEANAVNPSENRLGAERLLAEEEGAPPDFAPVMEIGKAVGKTGRLDSDLADELAMHIAEVVLPRLNAIRTAASKVRRYKISEGSGQARGQEDAVRWTAQLATLRPDADRARAEVEAVEAEVLPLLAAAEADMAALDRKIAEHEAARIAALERRGPRQSTRVRQ